MKIGIIILARTDSKRLKNKILLKLEKNLTTIDLLIRATKKVGNYKVIIATTSRFADNKLVVYLKKNKKYSKIAIYRGNHKNVFSRFYSAAKKYKLDVVIRLNGDSPLLDFRLLKKTLKIFLKKKLDLITNVYKRSFPSGQSIEIINFLTLKKYHNQIKTDYHKEHVMPFFYQKKIFKKIKSINIKSKINLANLSLSLDTKTDLEFIKKIKRKDYSSMNYLAKKRKIFDLYR
jgi:spore coat polysaccharide biosynthesis protein SpsF